jgi:hypothetical protein
MSTLTQPIYAADLAETRWSKDCTVQASQLSHAKMALTHSTGLDMSLAGYNLAAPELRNFRQVEHD